MTGSGPPDSPRPNRPVRRSAKAAAGDAQLAREAGAAARLALLALADGDEVRWRDPGRTTWTRGRVAGVAADGSLACTETAGKQRSIRPEHAQVLRRSPRGSLVWRAVVDGHVQLALFVEPARPLRPEVEAKVTRRRRGAPPAG